MAVDTTDFLSTETEKTLLSYDWRDSPLDFPPSYRVCFVGVLIFVPPLCFFLFELRGHPNIMGNHFMAPMLEVGSAWPTFPFIAYSSYMTVLALSEPWAFAPSMKMRVGVVGGIFVAGYFWFLSSAPALISFLTNWGPFNMYVALSFAWVISVPPAFATGNAVSKPATSCARVLLVVITGALVAISAIGTGNWLIVVHLVFVLGPILLVLYGPSLYFLVFLYLAYRLSRSHDRGTSIRATAAYILAFGGSVGFSWFLASGWEW